MNLTGIFSAWNLSKRLPGWIAVGLLCVLCFLFGQCNSGKKTQVTYLTEYRDSTVTITDSIITVRYKPVYVDRFHTVVVDVNHDCIDSGVVLSFGLDTVTFASVNSCKGEYVGAALSKGEFVHELDSTVEFPTGDNPSPFELTYKSTSLFGFRLDAILGPSLPGGTVIGVHGQAWFDRVSIFANPRLVFPDLSRSSVDVGVGYRVF